MPQIIRFSLEQKLRFVLAARRSDDSDFWMTRDPQVTSLPADDRSVMPY
jgi:hypothetical protein